jgi:putative component of membrane protein insertase Oxa1/YidC/SpoIIIJ protein YidD
MASAEIQGFVLLRFAPLFSGGIDALPPELRKMVLADEKKQERKSEKVGTIKIPLKKRNENE